MYGIIHRNAFSLIRESEHILHSSVYTTKIAKHGFCTKEKQGGGKGRSAYCSNFRVWRRSTIDLTRWIVDVEGMEDAKIFNGSVMFTAANRCIFEVVNRDCLCDVVNINIDDVRPPSWGWGKWSSSFHHRDSVFQLRRSPTRTHLRSFSVDLEVFGWTIVAVRKEYFCLVFFQARSKYLTDGEQGWSDVSSSISILLLLIFVLFQCRCSIVVSIVIILVRRIFARRWRLTVFIGWTLIRLNWKKRISSIVEHFLVPIVRWKRRRSMGIECRLDDIWNRRIDTDLGQWTRSSRMLPRYGFPRRGRMDIVLTRLERLNDDEGEHRESPLILSLSIGWSNVTLLKSNPSNCFHPLFNALTAGRMGPFRWGTKFVPPGVIVIDTWIITRSTKRNEEKTGTNERTHACVSAMLRHSFTG